MEMSTIIAAFGGLGVGSLLNSIFSYITSQKQHQKNRRYEEKKVAYIELINAIRDASVKYSVENSKNYALGQAKCIIFGSEDVVKFSKEFVEADKNDTPEVFDKLLNAIRSDLSKF